MIPQEVRIMIKHLSKQGESKQAIAERLGVCRKTVYNILKGKTDPERKARKSILEPYKEYIRGRLEKFNLTAKRLWQELKEKGFLGSYSTVKPFVREVKGRQNSKLTERYETLPGEQAQLDWGECGTIEVNGKGKKLYVFTLVLGYSRMMYACFTTSMAQPVLLECLKKAFQCLGVPESILVDNMKTAVDLHSPDGKVKWNAQFMDFAEHYGFIPLAAPPYWPRVKGKVESGVGYIKRSFLEGRQFVSLADLNSQMSHWLESEANVRIHGTTKVQPMLRYQEEAHVMASYQAFPVYPRIPKRTAKASWDCHVSFDGVLYSVPPEAANKEVEVMERDGNLRVIFQQREIASHPLAPKGSSPVRMKSHMLAARQMRKAHGKRFTGQCRYEQVESPLIETDLTPYDHLLRSVS